MFKREIMKYFYLLEHNECEWLDFKQCFHDNNVKLLHDIICLANAKIDKDRYLVFGVSDNKEIIGIENDKNKKTSSDIQDLLKNSYFNRIPVVNLDYKKCEDNHEVGILKIINKYDKPYFLTKDKKSWNFTLRAGVVYTRIGDTNTPLNNTAPEDHIEQMWKERFEISLPPLERMSKLLDNPNDWVQVNAENKMYHRIFTEFQIVEGEEINSDFVEEWTQKFPDPHASSFYIELYHYNTILKKSVFVNVDGVRYTVPLPEIKRNGEWCIRRDSIEYKIANLFDQYFPLEQQLPGAGVEIE